MHKRIIKYSFVKYDTIVYCCCDGSRNDTIEHSYDLEKIIFMHQSISLDVY